MPKCLSLLGLLASAGAMHAAAAADTASLSSLNWLAGCWTQTNGEAGTGEQWMTAAGGVMLGTARTVKNGRTVGWEFMRIEETEAGQLVFTAKPRREAEGSFALLRLSEKEVVFENIQHDFPQRIIYRRDSAQAVSASIEGMLKGKLKKIDYPLQRVVCEITKET
ncbi:DUF6265 family protein [Massilia sp. erpn]|uniref:DUF6265 family protein n=1 Tax=Massilia sp. erpn TaxID=2738142 RepID=UPI002105CBE7|nr:DUF6265 family protein [Massilia sp. erpn]UTY57096.1 hypothetical protein HPQ68_07750 [Massilia sp. erpn]